MENQKFNKYEDSFSVAVKFNDGPERFLMPHGAKVTDDRIETSLIACYKAIVKFVSKPRSQTIILLDAKDHIKERIDHSSYEEFGSLTIRHYHLGQEVEPVREYTILKATHCLFKE
jgi:hypothetical protein